MSIAALSSLWLTDNFEMMCEKIMPANQRLRWVSIYEKNANKSRATTTLISPTLYGALGSEKIVQRAQ